MNKQLITPENKRAAITEKIAKALFLIAWIILNYILYLQYK